MIKKPYHTTTDEFSKKGNWFYRAIGIGLIVYLVVL